MHVLFLPIYHRRVHADRYMPLFLKEQNMPLARAPLYAELMGKHRDEDGKDMEDQRHLRYSDVIGISISLRQNMLPTFISCFG